MSSLPGEDLIEHHRNVALTMEGVMGGLSNHKGGSSKFGGRFPNLLLYALM